MPDLLHFIDANIPMYAVGTAHPLKQPCVTILEAIAAGQLAAVTNSEVLQEILHRYTALGQRPRGIEVMHLFIQVVPEVLPVTKADLLLAAAFHGQHSTLTARLGASSDHATAWPDGTHFGRLAL